MTLATTLLDFLSLRVVLARDLLPLQISFIFHFQCSRKSHLWVLDVVFIVMGPPHEKLLRVDCDWFKFYLYARPSINCLNFIYGAKLHLKSILSKNTPIESQAISDKENDLLLLSLLLKLLFRVKVALSRQNSICYKFCQRT